jgi:hypothetical protein
MSATERRKALERDANRAFLRAKLIEAHEHAIKTGETSDACSYRRHRVMSEKFRIGQRVRYIPTHAHGDPSHKDCEDGIVRSFNPQGKPFVVYDNNIRGKMLTLELAEPWTAACTDPSVLVLLPEGDTKR